MCGLAGSISPRGVDGGRLEAMATAIAHRGPDGRGYLQWRPGEPLEMTRAPERSGEKPAQVGFAHLRLSIIDLRETNDQPLISTDGRHALSFNGEIYNYLELRDELEGLGHSFRTSGDTEVLLAAYGEWGPACVQRLVGMWAFALLDSERGTVLLSRDRFGIKPLYMAVAGGALHFASEIKALLEVPGTLGEPDPDVVRRYLLTGVVDESERTFFEGIVSLPAAHNAVVEVGAPAALPRPERYWRLPEQGYDGGRVRAAREFAERFFESVRLHARSDVPVGTCLSGGLDSSAIVCTADRLRRKGAIPSYAHHGFGYVPEDPAHSERRHMEEVVAATGLEMTYVEVPAERFDRALIEIVRQQDEPFGSTSIAAQYLVFEAAAAEGMKVMLDGQGADEVMGGYEHYFPEIAAALLRGRRFAAYARFARGQRRGRGAAPIGARHALYALAPAGVRDAAASRLPQPPAAALLAAQQRAGSSPADGRVGDFGSVEELFAAHTTSLGLPALLRFEDRNSMAHSIEARVPFLDHRLVEFCFRLPFDYKVHGATTKEVMREGLRDVLPERIRERTDKVGFRAEPAAIWSFAERNREALLASETPQEDRFLDPAGIRALLDGRDRSADAEFALWRAINMKLWLRRHWAPDGGGLEAVADG